VDFENETGGTTITQRWLVGDYKTGTNYSESSWSDQYYPAIEKDPVYVTAVINYDTNSLNASKVVPGDKIEFSYEVTYGTPASYNAIYEGLAGDPIEGVNVSLDLAAIALYNMTVLGNNWTYTDANGIATFILNVTDSTEDGLYVIPATADFENDSTIVSQVNATGSLRYWWINGTENSIGTANATFSNTTTPQIEVKRIRSIQTTILAVYDENGQVVTPVKTARRGYDIELRVLYRTQDLIPISENFSLIFQMSQIGGGIHEVKSPIINKTGLNGIVEFNFTILPTYNFRVEDIGVFANDTLQLPSDILVSYDNFTIVSNLTLVINSVTTLTSSNQAFINETLTIQGSIFDDQNEMGTDYYEPNLLNELYQKLLITGLNASNLSIASQINLTLSFQFDALSATFTAVWTIPYDYTGENLTILAVINPNATIEHFVDLPASDVSNVVLIYQSVASYNISVSYSDGTNLTVFDLEINITNDNRSISVWGFMLDGC
jgi:hypothetical protein